MCDTAREEGPEDPVPRPARVHNLSVRLKDIKEFGPTDHCPRCEHIEKYGDAQGCGQAHSHECRLGISPKLADTFEGRKD